MKPLKVLYGRMMNPPLWALYGDLRGMVGGWHCCDWTISRMTSLGGEWHIWIAVEVSGGGEKEWENQRDEKENEQKNLKNNFKVQLAIEYLTIFSTSAKSIYKTSNIYTKAKTGDINTENVLIS